MKRVILFLCAVVAFTGCSKDLWDCNGRTSKSAMEVMTSAEYWQEVRTHHYTEPNGGGDEYISYTEGMDVIGSGLRRVSMEDGKLIKYYSYAIPPEKPYYVEFIIEDLGNGMYSIKRESRDYYWKILSYDEDNLKIETDSYSIYHGGDQEYPYARVHFKRQTAPYPNWKDFYISYEEMLQQKEDEKNNQ
jgi:hypothetical protein